MTSEFTTEDRSIGFADGAKKLNLTPYQALIIASIAQAEVKFAADAPKVARVILNRLAANMPLQIDATSVYARRRCRASIRPRSTTPTIDSPYNTYLHNGLPPTPIGNPGESILQGRRSRPPPATGCTTSTATPPGISSSPTARPTSRRPSRKCRTENWGCG